MKTTTEVKKKFNTRQYLEGVRDLLIKHNAEILTETHRDNLTLWVEYKF